MNLLRDSVDLRKTMRCTECGRVGRPLLRVWGMPGANEEGEQLFRSQREGRLTLMGCCLLQEASPYECRHCGAETYAEGKRGCLP